MILYCIILSFILYILLYHIILCYIALYYLFYRIMFYYIVLDYIILYYMFCDIWYFFILYIIFYIIVYIEYYIYIVLCTYIFNIIHIYIYTYWPVWTWHLFHGETHDSPRDFGLPYDIDDAKTITINIPQALIGYKGFDKYRVFNHETLIYGMMRWPILWTPFSTNKFFMEWHSGFWTLLS